jgi:Restriction endonuclease
MKAAVAYKPGEITRLLALSDNASTADEKGAKLEALARYLFEQIAGIEFLDQNVLDKPRAHEIDLAFWNDQTKSTLSFLSNPLLVECKNHTNAVGSHDVGWFIRKLQVRGVFSAVLLSLSGISGTSLPEPSHAHEEIVSAMVADGIKVLLLTREEITSLDKPAELVMMLKKKFVQLTLRKIVALERGPGRSGTPRARRLEQGCPE